MKTCGISNCHEPAVEGYLPRRCTEHRADRLRRQRSSERHNFISSATSKDKCPDCGVRFGEVPFNLNCEGHARWVKFQNDAVANRIREKIEAQRADADRAITLLQALRDVYGIDLITGR